jgi:hypothetical protein
VKRTRHQTLLRFHTERGIDEDQHSW